MLEAKDLKVGYNNRYMIKRVDLCFEPGKIYTIVGRNGSGKSGLLRSLTGQIVLNKGKVLLDGKEINGPAAKRIAYLGKHKDDHKLTVAQLMARSMESGISRYDRLDSDERKRIQSILGSMRASGLLNTPVYKLSCGERKRIMIAKMLVQNADYYLIDEPTVFLDPGFQQLFRNQIKQLRAAGKTVIMVTHDLSMALQCSDEIIAIDLGKEIYCGTPEKMLADGTLSKIFHAEISA